MKAGHSALGVEFSYHMLLTSNLILNSSVLSWLAAND